MKIRKIIVALLITLTTSCAYQGANQGVGPVSVRVIAFNDFHGNLVSPGDFLGKASGGVDYLASYVNSLKLNHPYHVVVSAGDLTGASPFLSSAFHDEGTIETMNRLGLEYNALGNHEFDNDKNEILRKQNGGCFAGGVVGLDTCLGAASPNPVPVPNPFEGAKFKYLSANVLVKSTGKTLFPSYDIKHFVTETGNNIRIGFIGIALKDTPSMVTPASVADLAFLDEVETVNQLVPKLRSEGVETIVVLVHQGGKQGSTVPNSINDCSLKSGDVDDPLAVQPIRELVKGLDNAVDVVISGHTHTEYTCQLPNRLGRLIPVTQAGSYGHILTSIDLTIDPSTGDVINSGLQNHLVDRTNPDIVPDSTMATIVEAYNLNLAPIANKVVASLLASVPNAELPAKSPATGTTGEKPAGDLIADAMLSATAKHGLGDAQIALMITNGIRTDYANKVSPFTYPYELTYGDAFAVQPYSNYMVTMTLTARHIKDVLEMQFPGNSCATPSGINNQNKTRVLQPSRGFYFSWSASGANCNKIRDVILTTYDSTGNVASTDTIVRNGILASKKHYRVTVNNYMADGGDNFSVFKSGTDLIVGVKDIEATVDYLAQFITPNPNNPGYDPNAISLHKPRIDKLQ